MKIGDTLRIIGLLGLAGCAAITPAERLYRKVDRNQACIQFPNSTVCTYEWKIPGTEGCAIVSAFAGYGQSILDVEYCASTKRGSFPNGDYLGFIARSEGGMLESTFSQGNSGTCTCDSPVDNIKYSSGKRTVNPQDITEFLVRLK